MVQSDAHKKILEPFPVMFDQFEIGWPAVLV